MSILKKIDLPNLEEKLLMFGTGYLSGLVVYLNSCSLHCSDVDFGTIERVARVILTVL